jgi:hypothetical protein
LAGELQREATHRPPQTPTAEQALAAFQQAGVLITRTQQVLASPLSAHYCVAASTADGAGFSLCEFDDVARAETGRARSQKAMKGHRFVLREKTLLTVIGNAPSADKAMAAFEALSAK